jgi:translocation and assembly module TamA
MWYCSVWFSPYCFYGGLKKAGGFNHDSRANMNNCFFKSWLLLGFFMSMAVKANEQPKISYQLSELPEHIEHNILVYLNSKEYDCQSLLTSISQQHKDMQSQIIAAVQPYGYFNSQIKVNTSANNKCKPLEITVDLGPVTTIRKAEIIVEAHDDDFKTLLSTHKLLPGKPLIQPRYEAIKKQLVQLANEKIYLDAHFTVQSLEVFPDSNQADVTLVFEPGKRYVISEINLDVGETILGKHYLNRSLIEKLITIKPNSYLTYNDLYKLKQKLNSYGYFEQVMIEIDEQAKSKNGVPLLIKLTPAPKYDYSVGLGFSTDAGAKASLKYNNHRINGRGHQLSSQLDFSELSHELKASYKIPSRNKPASKWFNVLIAYRDEQTNQVDSQTSKLGFSQTRISNKGWQNVNFLDLLHERFDTGQDENDSLLLVPGVSWSITNADKLPRPANGYKLQTEIKGASEDIFSDASFVQITLVGKFIHSVSDRNRLLYRAHFGATASSDFNEMPTTYRFFAGGDQNLRGYDYESIAPISNVTGDLVGGKHLAVGSVEFEHQFAPQWAVAAFTDFGDAFTNSFDFKYSVGAGIRWFSPIGPIRVDLGIPLNQSENDFRLHVTIGPDL